MCARLGGVAEGVGRSAGGLYGARPLPCYTVLMTPYDDEVRLLSRRVSHATHALLVASKEHNMPVTSAEVVIYDAEALGVVATAAALRAAARHRPPLAVFTGRYWVPTNHAQNLRSSLENRYLTEAH